MNDTVLRKQVKMLKATEAINNYYEIANLLEISNKSFYNWLSGYYNLSEQKKNKLNVLISDLSIIEE